jgi:hypothetical protein
MTTIAVGLGEGIYRFVADGATRMKTTNKSYATQAIEVYRRMSVAGVGMAIGDAKSFQENVDGDRYEITLRRIERPTEVRDGR